MLYSANSREDLAAFQLVLASQYVSRPIERVHNEINFSLIYMNHMIWNFTIYAWKISKVVWLAF